METTRFGIEAVAVRLPSCALELKDLALARGVDPAKYLEGLGCYRMSLCAPDEDPVTLAAGAVSRLLQVADVRPSDIGMLIVGSESGVDASKPIAAYVHGLLGLPNACRTFDTQHACYGATAGLQLAAAWATRSPDRKAVVVASDIARYDVGSAGEPTQGAGAVAMLVSSEPALVAIQSHPDAVFTEDVWDFWRPHYRTTAVVDGKYSVQCYLKALEHTWAAYREATGQGIPDHDRMLFHIPFPKMAYKAFRHLHGLESERGAPGLASLEEDYRARVVPTLWAGQEVGNVYSGSLYLALAGLVEQEGQGLPGRRLSFFSYGSGSCAEFFGGVVGPAAARLQGRVGLLEDLSRRNIVDVATYERMRVEVESRNRNGSWDDPTPLPDRTVRFLGIADHRRVYAAPRFA